jgi:hypothetical protein
LFYYGGPIFWGWGRINKRCYARCKILCITSVAGSCISITEHEVSDTAVREAVSILVYWMYVIHCRLHCHKGKGKTIAVTGREGPYVCETSRFSHLLDNQLTDGSQVVSFTRQAIPVTGHECPYVCETSRFSHLLENQLTDGSQVVSFTRQAVPVTGHEGPYVCETSRFSHLLDSRLRSSGEVVSLTRPPHCTPQEDFWYSFLLEAESTPEP